MTEVQIVQGCRRRDRAAQRALYDLTHERVHRMLLRMLRNPEDAADVLQDTFIRAFDRIHQFHEEAGVSTWVYRIAINEALQFLRKHRRREKTTIEMPPTEASRSSDTEGVDMRDALDQLPEDERTLLILKYYQGMNYAEMSELLERPPGTIASGLNRAREMLRGLLGAVGKKGGPEETAPARHPTE